MTSKEYWAERTARAQAKLTNKNIKQTEKQLRKYYNKTMKRVINDFEATYNRIMADKAAGKEVTPADLYKLDRYWTMQAQLKKEAQKLGDRQIAALSKMFELQFFDVYYSFAIPSKRTYTEISAENARQLINTIWCVDGKSFSDRVWDNVNDLVETLNSELINSVITGRNPDKLKGALVERFGVSYSRADSVVRTEMSHIQNTAAQQRYKDYGVQQYEVWADYDERRCDVCGSLHQKKYYIHEKTPVPVHPRCRCSIIPVIED